jgi:hypothetical protein
LRHFDPARYLFAKAHTRLHHRTLCADGKHVHRIRVPWSALIDSRAMLSAVRIMPKKTKTEEPPEGVLVTAAKTIGAAAGKVAAAVGIATPPKPKVPKLAKKHKSRLPRKQKKAAKKAVKSAKVPH